MELLEFERSEMIKWLRETEKEEEIKPKKSKKSHEIFDMLDNYVVIDIETTGFSSCNDEIIEIAAVKVENNIIVSQFSSLIKPSKSVDCNITSITGISNEMLINEPDISIVLPQFIEFVDDYVVIAHNASFDLGFVKENCLNLGLEFNNDFSCTMKISKMLFKNVNGHRLENLVRRFNIADEVKHRALSDVINTYKCYEFMKNCGDKMFEICEEKEVKRKSSKFSKVKPKDIKPNSDKFDETSQIFGRKFVFTGELQKIERASAWQLVVSKGGIVADNVTRDLNYLVVVNPENKTSKVKKAEEYILKGLNINIISEFDFYDMFNEEELV